MVNGEAENVAVGMKGQHQAEMRVESILGFLFILHYLCKKKMKGCIWGSTNKQMTVGTKEKLPSCLLANIRPCFLHDRPPQII